jgi:hypothetical protein
MFSKIAARLLGERSWIRRTGDFRTRESYGLIGRPNYVYGMLRAADNAKYFGKASVSIIEMGVANGDGLLSMIEYAEMITAETGVKFRIVGFDTGAGLPSVKGHRDHPEIWNPGDFAMQDRDSLLKKIDGRAQIIWGDVDTTIGPFIDTLTEICPLGFISVDFDIYSATKSGLRCLTGDPTKYLPAVSMYFDDVGFFFANRWCGELLAIDEFNTEHEWRKIDTDRSLPGRRPLQPHRWYGCMYACHILDHPSRQTPRERGQLPIMEHLKFARMANI